MTSSRPGRWWGVLAAAWILGGLLVWDLGRPPDRQSTARWLLAGIDGYQAVLSPAMSALGARCRFRPSCSHYAEAVIRRDGAWRGGLRALGRVLRCGPWTPAGTPDPP